MASRGINSTNTALCSNELATWWEHYDLMVESIKDPDALAEAACRASLVSADMKDMIIGFSDAQAKTRSLLQMIEGKVKNDCNLLHKFLTVLGSLRLAKLVSRLQDSYSCRVIGRDSPTAVECDEDKSSTCMSEAESDDVNDSEVSHADCTELSFEDVNDSILSDENALDVKEVTVTLAARFYPLGIALGLPSSKLDEIRQNYPRDCNEALSQVIIAWLKQSYDTSKHGHPSWKKLVEAIASEAGGQHPALARKIAAAHRASRKRQQSNDEGVPRPKQPHIEDGPLVKFRPKLADFYSKKPEVPEGTWPPVKKTHFVNLALIKQTAINFAKDYVRQTVHGSIDDIIKDKEQIDYKDVFANLEDGALVLMEGRPGCGKTTLMHKLSQDWEKQEILASCLFFLVHFRRFSNRSDIELSDILRASTMDYTDEEIKELCTCIEKDSGRGVVFALDGLDEYCPKSKQNLLYNLIKRERLSNAVVIVASRPAASQKFRKYATKHVEVLGFLKPQIQEYIEGYFCQCPEKAQSLRRYLDHRLNVMHMCYLPLHSAMVTYLYDIEGANLPQTETEIYRHFTLWTLIRSIQKRSDDPDEPFILNDFSELSPDDRLVFNLILKLAFNATIESKQVFTLKEVKEQISEQLTSSGSGNDGDSLGLIVIDRYFVKYGLDEIYTFLHLTFQEFLCAYYIANQTEEKQKEILETHGSKENLAEVWKFFCGVGKCSSENFSILLHKARCKVKAEKNRSRKITVPNTLLHLHCTYESQKEWMCFQVIQQCASCITLHDQSLTPSDMTALGYIAKHSTIPIKQLNITHCHLGVEGLTALLMEIGDHELSLEKLSFSDTKIKPEMVEKFAAFLTVCSSVEDLDLSWCVSKSTLMDIGKKIHKLSSLTTLNISSNRVMNTDDAIKAFINKLPKLQMLKTQLDWLKITDEEAELIAEQMKNSPNLYEISLYWNQIGDAGAHAIAEGCKLCPNLQKVDLDNNSITDASVPHLVGLMETARKLKNLYLQGNQFTEAGRSQLRQAKEKRNNDPTNYDRLDLYIM